MIFFLGVIGLLCSLWGGIGIFKSYKEKEVTIFTKNNKQTILFDRTGIYGVHLIGGFEVTNVDELFKMKIKKNNSEKSIKIIRNIIKWKTLKNKKKGVYLYRFKVDELGKYEIIVQNLENLVVRSSMSFSLMPLQKKVPTESIFISIKKDNIPIMYILYIMSLVSGVNLLIYLIQTYIIIPQILN